MKLLFLTPSLGNVSAALVCLIISLILLFIAAFIAPSPTAPPWSRLNFGWAGMFFYVLAVALS